MTMTPGHPPIRWRLGVALALAFCLPACRREAPAPAPPAASTPAATPAPRPPEPAIPAAPSPPASPTPRAAKEPPPPAATPEPRVVSTTKGTATWYDPPENSKPVQRAPGEFTAAYDRFPMGTRVRVTNLANDESVIVRVTDRGVPNAKAIDLCKEAAEEIGLLKKGETKVTIERLADGAEEEGADEKKESGKAGERDKQ